MIPQMPDRNAEEIEFWFAVLLCVLGAICGISTFVLMLIEH